MARRVFTVDRYQEIKRRLAEGRDVRESMSVPVGEQALEDLGDDDLEPIDESEMTDIGEAPHVADDDGPTLTSEAPPPNDDD